MDRLEYTSTAGLEKSSDKGFMEYLRIGCEYWWAQRLVVRQLQVRQEGAGMRPRGECVKPRGTACNLAR